MPEATVPCPTCGKPLSGHYCAQCGEKRFSPEDHGLKRSFEQMFVAFTHADGTVFRTLRTLLAHPGRLTADYLKGRRKPYIAPLELFLICNLIFFLLHPVIGSNTLTTDLNTQLHYSWQATVAQSLVAPRLAARAMTVEAYAVIFDAAAVTQAKSFVILVVPIFSIAVMALYWRQRRHYTAHLVFSLHFCACWLLLICATLALTNLTVRLLRSGHIFPSDLAVSRGIVAFSLAAMTAYLFRAVRVVFGREANWVTLGKALALGLALDLSLQAYRFVLFFITFWST
jgi:hypothetical protein